MIVTARRFIPEGAIFIQLSIPALWILAVALLSWLTSTTIWVEIPYLPILPMMAVILWITVRQSWLSTVNLMLTLDHTQIYIMKAEEIQRQQEEHLRSLFPYHLHQQCPPTAEQESPDQTAPVHRPASPLPLDLSVPNLQEDLPKFADNIVPRPASPQPLDLSVSSQENLPQFLDNTVSPQPNRVDNIVTYQPNSVDGQQETNGFPSMASDVPTNWDSGLESISSIETGPGFPQDTKKKENLLVDVLTSSEEDVEHNLKRSRTEETPIAQDHHHPHYYYQGDNQERCPQTSSTQTRRKTPRPNAKQREKIKKKLGAATGF